MKKTSIQTKSFIVLMGIVLVGCLVNLALSNDLKKDLDRQQNSEQGGDYQIVTYKPKEIIKSASAQEQPVDTAAWKTFEDAGLKLSFKYKPDWKIKPEIKKNGFTIIEIDPGKKYYNIRLYVSAEGYYGLESMPYAEESINGNTALNVSDMLYGFKYGGNFYTFDIGFSTSLRPEFKAMVQSVAFLP